MSPLHRLITCCALFSFVTVHNEVAKVMFLQACDCPQGGGGVVCSGRVSVGGGSVLGRCLLPGVSASGGVCSVLRQPPPRRDSYCCGWYASYWNAFLFENSSSKRTFNLWKDRGNRKV